MTCKDCGRDVPVFLEHIHASKDKLGRTLCHVIDTRYIRPKKK